MEARKSVPTLVIAEQHLDPIIGKILALLASLLKEMGYEIYLNESPPGGSLELAIESIRIIIINYEAHRLEFKLEGLDITDSSHVDQFIARNELDEKEKKMLLFFIQQYPQAQTWLTFLLALQDQDIRFVGADNYDLSKLKIEEFTDPSLFAEHVQKRDVHLSRSYLSTSEPAFACVGLAHVKGIQKEILKKISYEEASARFCFINLHSLPPEPKGHPFNPHYEEEMRAGKIELPLGMLQLDAANKSDNEIIEIILNTLREKQEQLDEYYHRQPRTIVTNKEMEAPHLLFSRENLIATFNMLAGPLAPKLVFLESHVDPILGKSLAKLLPVFKELKRDLFLNELPASYQLDQAIYSIKIPLNLFESMKADFDRYGLDIRNEADVEKFAAMQDEIEPEKVIALVGFLLKALPSNLSFLKFLEKLKRNNIAYRGIDVDYTKDGKTLENLKSIEWYKSRCAALCDSYLAETSPFFSTIGLGNIQELQEAILRRLSREEANQQFCFVYVYSQPPLIEDTSNYPEIAEFCVTESDFRNGNVRLPLPVIQIDGSQKTQHEITRLILQEWTAHGRQVQVESSLEKGVRSF